jgi:CRISPR/Cas system-associated exonuclease Cas4 (RecB family)
LEKLTDFQMPIYSKLLYGVKNRDFAFIEVLKSGDFIYLKDSDEKEKKLSEILKELSKQKELVASRCEDYSICRNCAYKLLCHRGEYL